MKITTVIASLFALSANASPIQVESGEFIRFNDIGVSPFEIDINAEHQEIVFFSRKYGIFSTPIEFKDDISGTKWSYKDETSCELSVSTMAGVYGIVYLKQKGDCSHIDLTEDFSGFYKRNISL